MNDATFYPEPGDLEPLDRADCSMCNGTRRMADDIRCTTCGGTGKQLTRDELADLDAVYEEDTDDLRDEADDVSLYNFTRPEYSPSYRASMIDAGRGHLLP